MKLETSLITFFLTLIHFCGYRVCQQSPKEVGAVAGLSVLITCDGNINEAPFWFINGTVYELFSIPRHFPFIPFVDSYSHLTIPNVPLTVDHTTFQCAHFSENGLNNGTCTLLIVFPASGNVSCGGFKVLLSAVSELVINYQELFILENRTFLSWFSSDTCSESVVVQGYTLDTGEPVLSPDHVFTASSSDHSVTVRNTHSDISYKLLGLNESGHECPSTRDIYYRFNGTLEILSLNFTSTPSLYYPIPQTDMCSSGLNFVWASREAGRSCVCPAHNSTAGRLVFESCVKGCRGAVLTPVLTEQGSICISNLTFSESLFHFVCSTEHCGVDVTCLLQTIIASYILIPESTTTEDGEDIRCTAEYTGPQPAECPTSYPLIISITLAVGAAVVESVIVGVLSICVLKYRQLGRNVENISAHPETVNISPLPTSIRSHDDLTVAPPLGPEYEEIQDVCQAKISTNKGHTGALGSEDRGKHALSGDYEFTKCPAYAVTTNTV